MSQKKMIVELWPCLSCFDYVCHTVAMFAIYYVWLLHYGNICHILSMIATMCQCLPCLIMIGTIWPCLPSFEYDWLLYCGHVCHILSMIATLHNGGAHDHLGSSNQVNQLQLYSHFPCHFTAVNPVSVGIKKWKVL